MRKALIIAFGLAGIALFSSTASAAQRIGGECLLNGGALREYSDVIMCYSPSGDATDCYSKSGGACDLLAIDRIDVGKPLQPRNPKGSSGANGQAHPGSTPAHSGGTPGKGTATTKTTTTSSMPGPGPLHIVVPPPANNIQTQKNIRQN